MRIDSVGVFAFPGKMPQFKEVLQVFASWSKATGTPVLCLDSLKESAVQGIRYVSASHLQRTSALVAVGGDGTVIAAAHLVLGRKIPILGVNAGRIGFLAEVQTDRLQEALNDLTTGRFRLRERIMLDCTVRAARRKVCQETALNEVLIRPNQPGAMADLSVDLNGKPLTEYWADGLLVATPTGSTAYNLSAGGPIIHPLSQALVLTPISPGSLSVRPLVIAADSLLQFRTARAQEMTVILDGHAVHTLAAGEILEVRKSQFTTVFLRVGSQGFVDALREKLGWSGRPGIRNPHAV